MYDAKKKDVQKQVSRKIPVTINETDLHDHNIWITTILSKI